MSCFIAAQDLVDQFYQFTSLSAQTVMRGVVAPCNQLITRCHNSTNHSLALRLPIQWMSSGFSQYIINKPKVTKQVFLDVTVANRFNFLE